MMIGQLMKLNWKIPWDLIDSLESIMGFVIDADRDCKSVKATVGSFYCSNINRFGGFWFEL